MILFCFQESLSSQSILTSSIPIASSYINVRCNDKETILRKVAHRDVVSLSRVWMHQIIMKVFSLNLCRHWMNIQRILYFFGKNGEMKWSSSSSQRETVVFFSCQQLENRPLSNDAQTQSSLDQQDQTCQTNDDEDNPTRNERENFECELGVLKDEINILNFQLSSARIHQTHNEQVKVNKKNIWICFFHGEKHLENCLVQPKRKSKMLKEKWTNNKQRLKRKQMKSVD